PRGPGRQGPGGGHAALAGPRGVGPGRGPALRRGHRRLRPGRGGRGSRAGGGAPGHAGAGDAHADEGTGGAPGPGRAPAGAGAGVSLCAVVPVKRLDSAKSRLRRVVVDRPALALAMLRNVLDALVGSGTLEALAVVSPDERVRPACEGAE